MVTITSLLEVVACNTYLLSFFRTETIGTNHAVDRRRAGKVVSFNSGFKGIQSIKIEICI